MAIGQMPNWVQFHFKVKLPYRFENSFLFVFLMGLNKIEYLKKRREKGKGHRCIRGYWHTGAEHAVISLLSVTPFLPLLLHLQANKHRRRKKENQKSKEN